MLLSLAPTRVLGWKGKIENFKFAMFLFETQETFASNGVDLNEGMGVPRLHLARSRFE